MQLPAPKFMKVSPLAAAFLTLSLLGLSGCAKTEEHAEGAEGEEHRALVVTSPAVKDVISTEQYVCQIHSRQHIEIRALEGGYLAAIPVQEGQAVKTGDPLFKIVPTLYQAKLDAEVAEAQLAQIEFDNTTKLFQKGVVSDREVALAKAKLAKASAQVDLARAELNFTDLKAPFDGIIDRLHEQLGSLVEEGDELTSLSDNSVMWVYFNVPEARYLEYKAELARHAAAGDEADPLQIELVLANATTFNQQGHIAAIEAEFNNETGNIAFRADFPNPESLLRHGQTGNVLIHHTVHDAIVIPQRATFEVLDKIYVFLVDKDNVVHQSEIEIEHEMEDIYVIKSGVKADDKIMLEGVRQVRDGETVEFEFRPSEEVLSNLKFEAE